MEEIRRSNADDWEQEELEDMLDRRDREIRRNFYVDEVLAVTVDYLNVAQEHGVAFPRERTFRQPPRQRGLLGLGLGF